MKNLRISLTATFLLICLIPSASAGFFDFWKKEPTYAKTKYPIVMVPGAFAFDNAFGILDYWHGITDELRDEGADVYVTNLSSMALHEVRGEELLSSVEEIMAITGANKVNLIAHSQGATAARYVAALRPEWIASVSCTHCMNEGTPFGQGLNDTFEDGTFFKQAGVTLMNGLFNFIESGSAKPSDGEYNSAENGDQNARALLTAVSAEDFDRFNALYPQAMPAVDCSIINNGIDGHTGGGAHIVNGVRYYSWGGKKNATRLLDPLDALIIPVVQLFMPKGIVADGLVPSCGQALGEFLRDDYRTNHFDAINQTAGMTAAFVDVPSIFVIQANRLKKAGL
jgi:triacylglycerol lipase